METENRAPVEEENPRPDVLKMHYKVLVIDPYAVNIKDIGPNSGDVRLSFYSAFVNHVAREIIEDGLADEVIVFDDASFGSKHKSTGDLTVDYLTRDRFKKGPGRPDGSNGSNGYIGPIIDRGKVTLYKGDNMARTPTQVEKVAKHLKDRGRAGEEVLYLGWDYHRERVGEHARGFGLNLQYVAAEQIHKFYEPKFKYDKLMELLPMSQIEQMEGDRRKWARRDRRGIVPAVIQSLPIIGGPRMLDNKRNKDGKLEFDYRQGKKRLKELEIK